MWELIGSLARVFAEELVKGGVQVGLSHLRPEPKMPQPNAMFNQPKGLSGQSPMSPANAGTPTRPTSAFGGGFTGGAPLGSTSYGQRQDQGNLGGFSTIQPPQRPQGPAYV